MRASNPKIQNIDLVDILSYRQRDYEKKIQVSGINNHKKRHQPQKNMKEIMKQI